MTHLTSKRGLYIIALVTFTLTMASCGGGGVGPDPCMSHCGDDGDDGDGPGPSADKVTFVVTVNDQNSVAKDGTIYVNDDSVAAGKTTFEKKQSELPIDICAGGPFFLEKQCKTNLSPSGDRTEVTFQLTRKPTQVKLLLTYPGRNHPIMEVPVLAPNNVAMIDGHIMNGPYGVKTNGQYDSFKALFKANLKSRAKPRHLAIDYGKDQIDRQISGSDSLFLKISLKDWPNCSDGLPGNDADGKMDGNDPGCATAAGWTVDKNGNIHYTPDPEDNYELTKYYNGSFISHGSKKTVFISDKKGHQKFVLTKGNVLSGSVSLSVATRIKLFIRLYVTTNDKNEDVKVIVATGPDFSNTFSFKVMDNGSQGWTQFGHDVPPNFFANSRNLKVTVKYIGDNDGKVGVLKKTNKTITLVRIKWGYEPEDVPPSKRSQAKRRTSQYRRGMKVVFHEGNRGVVFKKRR